MQSIKTKDVFLYVTMPRIVPRVKDIFSSGFAYVAFLMAHIYYMARLLPVHHPYLLQENIGRFGVRHVIVEASSNLRFSKNNIDQIIIYFSMLAGILMLAAQLLILIYGLVVQPAMAFSWFDTADPQTDIAYNLLDRVFGVPGIYCSTASICTDYSTTYSLPLPFHQALHGLFQFYSTGLLLIALLIFLYFVVVIVLETAVSGTPFGKRFQNVWVPIRLVVALGLLVPINYGLGSGQYIVLYAAKYGSSFATNGWLQYNNAVTSHSMFSATPPTNETPVGEGYTLLAIPEMPDISPVIQAMSLVHTCAYAYHRLNSGFTQGNLNTTTGSNTSDRYPVISADYTDSDTLSEFMIQPFFVKTKTAGMDAADGDLLAGPSVPALTGDASERVFIPETPGSRPNYLEALGFYFGNDIIIRFGEYKTDSAGNTFHKDETGGVKPLCGDVRIPVSDLSDPGGVIATPSRGGPDAMLRFYYDITLMLWFDMDVMKSFSRSYVSAIAENNFAIKRDLICPTPMISGTVTQGFWPTNDECARYPPTVKFKAFMKTMWFEPFLQAQIQTAWRDYIINGETIEMQTATKDYGWGGAGIWYNKIAEINGGWMDAVRSVPSTERYPLVMEQIKQYKMRHNESVSTESQYDPTVKTPSGEEAPQQVDIPLGDKVLMEVGEPLAAVYAYWNHGNQDVDRPSRQKVLNAFMDGMNMLLGTSGLASMRGANQHLHPLAQLVAVGKGLVNSAIFNMASASATAFLGGMLGALKKYQGLAGAMNAASQAFYSVAFLGITAGFVLFYVLPFLPFIYFYFAVASWVKSIFEAMVGVPLWALAHLRIDGEGLPGDAAQGGYLLILDIMIRPILTVVGLIAAITIFSAQVRILNLIWDLVTTNLSGNTPTADILGMSDPSDIRFHRGVVDQFFFTIIYTIVVYMLGMSSFKLIDKIPDNILRWIGGGVSAFSDMEQEQIESINRYASVGGMTIGNQAAGAIREASGGMGRTIGGQLGKLAQDGGKGSG